MGISSTLMLGFLLNSAPPSPRRRGNNMTTDIEKVREQAAMDALHVQALADDREEMRAVARKKEERARTEQWRAHYDALLGKVDKFAEEFGPMLKKAGYRPSYAMRSYGDDLVCWRKAGAELYGNTITLAQKVHGRTDDWYRHRGPGSGELELVTDCGRTQRYKASGPSALKAIVKVDEFVASQRQRIKDANDREMEKAGFKKAVEAAMKARFPEHEMVDRYYSIEKAGQWAFGDCSSAGASVQVKLDGDRTMTICFEGSPKKLEVASVKLSGKNIPLDMIIQEVA